MLGASHAIMSFAFVYGVTGRVLPASVASAGAIFPDSIERIVCGRRWMKYHRKWSHWFPPYLALAWLTGKYLEANPFPGLIESIGGDLYVPVGPKSITATTAFFLFWWLVGCLLHLAEDAFFGPMPLLVPWKRQRLFLQIFKTGGLAERVMARAALTAAVVLRYVDAAAGIVG